MRKFALGVWAALALAITASLAGTHWITLPRPDPAANQLQHAVAGLREPGDSGWMSVHALYAHCRCSQRILNHLIARRALPSAREYVVSIGPQPEREAELQRAGYRVTKLSPLQLKHRFGAVAVPLLIVADEGDVPRYVGGYTTHKQGPDIRDVSIIRDTQRNLTPGPLPLFGCAVSRSLQRLLDPFGIKY